jgi:glucosamine kinase
LSVYIGIDGGGTRAVALVVDSSGEELARVEGQPGLIRVTDPAAGAAALSDLAARALSEAGAEPVAVVMCCGLAGAGREPERRGLEVALQLNAPARRVIVITDAEAALYDAFGSGPGILLIAGTGSIAWGRAHDGRVARCGGWGHILGDEGSGYSIGLAALRASVRAHDGRSETTLLLEAILRHTGVSGPEALVGWSASATKGKIGALAPLVTRAAEQDDRVARVIVETAAGELALHVSALYRRMMPWEEPPGIALGGGLIAPGGPMRDVTIDALRSLSLPIVVREDVVDGARGAAKLALRSG